MNAKSCRISVVIPCYNVEPYIIECLDSVVKQSFSDIEILCIDDCGSDLTSELIHQYSERDSRIRIISHKKNCGLSIARNTGITHARGEYIFFLDSDDYIEPQSLALLYTQASKDCKPDLVFSGTRCFLSGWAGKEAELRKEGCEHSIKKRTQAFIGRVTKKNIIEFARSTSPVSWGVLIKKEFLLENKIYFANKNIIHQDVGFFMKLILNKPYVIKVTDQIVNWRLRQESISTSKSRQKSRTDLNASLQDAIDYYKASRGNLVKLSFLQKKRLFKKKKGISLARMWRGLIGRLGG